jgi:hypothetical protein
VRSHCVIAVFYPPLSLEACTLHAYRERESAGRAGGGEVYMTEGRVGLAGGGGEGSRGERE